MGAGVPGGPDLHSINMLLELLMEAGRYRDALARLEQCRRTFSGGGTASGGGTTSGGGTAASGEAVREEAALRESIMSIIEASTASATQDTAAIAQTAAATVSVLQGGCLPSSLDKGALISRSNHSP